MKILTLTLRNIKGLADQTFHFGEKAHPRGWTLLLGENGLCKTTILQCIALATSGDRLARALVEDASEFVSLADNSRGAIIEATFLANGQRHKTQLVISKASYAFETRTDEVGFNEVRARRLPDYFVAAYGVGRYLPRRGEVAVPADPVKDRIEGIFSPHHKMLGIDFFEALKQKKLHLKYAKALREILAARTADGARLLPLLEEIDLRGKNGVNDLSKLLESRRFSMNVGAGALKLPAHLLSQGYQSMIAWIADLLGHAFLERGEVSAKSLDGIVLLDEIDLHLHPTWQRVLVPLLRQVFPKLQFIATTHSPLVLAGCDASEVLELERGERGIEHRQARDEPGLQTGSELFGRFFHVPHAARPELLNEHRELLRLTAIPRRTAAQEKQRAALLKRLRPYAVAATPPAAVAEREAPSRSKGNSR